MLVAAQMATLPGPRLISGQSMMTLTLLNVTVSNRFSVNLRQTVEDMYHSVTVFCLVVSDVKTFLTGICYRKLYWVLISCYPFESLLALDL